MGTCVHELFLCFIIDTRKVTFTQEQMENWKPLSEETFKNVARTIETAKQ